MNQIKEITLSTGKWLFVEVPKVAEQLEVSIQPDKIPCLTYYYKDNLDPTVISLPAGHAYTLIGKADRLNMDQIYELIKGSKYSLNRLCEEYNVDKSTTVLIKQD